MEGIDSINNIINLIKITMLRLARSLIRFGARQAKPLVLS